MEPEYITQTLILRLKTFSTVSLTTLFLILLLEFCILKWLNNSYRKKGPSGAIGYHSSEDIADTLSMLGFERARIEDEITTLVKYKLILNESTR